MITRTRLTTTVVLTAASLTAGTVAAAGLALGGGLRVAAPLGLGVSLAAAAVGLVVTLRMVAGTTGRLAHLAAQYEAAHRDARTDALTSLWNRRHFDERMAAAVARMARAIRSATRTASVGRVRSNSTANSSPPHLQAKSDSRVPACRRAAMCCRAVSPARCPYRSLTALKSSRSKMATLKGSA